MRLLFGSLLMLAAVFAAILYAAPDSDASPLTCTHRSSAHLAEHGGRQADDAYHLSRGEPANCDEEKESSDQRDDDDQGIVHHRDRVGPHIGPVWSWFN